MQTCYVSIPYGRKASADGQLLDFDYLYAEVIRPVVEEMGIECHRLDDYSPGVIWHKTLFRAIIWSDLVIADITTGNPNVLYELGIRHALRRGRTIVISAQKGPPPSNISYVQALGYQPDTSGQLSGESAAKFREALQASIRQSQRSPISDSPIYEFFPDLEVILPPELEATPHRSRAGGPREERGFAQTVVESPAQARGDLEKSEAQMRSAPDADPGQYLTLMRRYRDLSDWDRVVALAGDAPSALSQSPEVRQLLALALNRRGQAGDQDRAIALMEAQIQESGGDSETFGILGRIYKDRFDHAKERGDLADAAANLEGALLSYRTGFERNPRDYYAGINVVNLLLQRGDDAASAELSTIVPVVRAVVREKLDAERPDFWDLATYIQLAAVERDWDEAEQAARSAVAQEPGQWMLETTIRSMRAFGESLTDPHDVSQLQKIVALLEPREDEAVAEHD